jgi:putative ABC transport system ATP-binding protein
MQINKIVLKNIKKTYGKTANSPGKVAINIDDFTIPLVGIVSIIGWSGSGKSTLFNLICLVDIPDIENNPDPAKLPEIQYHMDDRVYFARGKDNKMHLTYTEVGKKGEHSVELQVFRKEVGALIFQRHHLHPNLNLQDNIKTPYLSAGKNLPDEDLTNSSNYFGIEELLKKYPHEVSGGEGQRAAILRGVLKNSPILFADEPTSSLDRIRSEGVLFEIDRLIKDDNEHLQCLIWVSHDLHLIQHFAEHIITINDGKLISISFERGSLSVAEILDLLKQDSAGNDGHESEHSVSLPIETKASFWEMSKYYLTYAKNDLVVGKFRPTTDFLVVFLSILVILVFLLSIMKLGYGTSKYLELKLSDPRINSLEVTSSVSKLTENHVKILSEKLEGKVKYVTPVYSVNVNIYDLKKNKTRSHGMAMTFRPDDPVLKEILHTAKNLPLGGGALLPFVTDIENWKGIIIKRSSMERFNYAEDADSVVVRFVNFNENTNEFIPALVVDTPLPFNKRMMIRESFYLDAYQTIESESKPDMRYIVLYPNSINDTLEIKKIIESLDGFEIKEAFKVLSKIKVINEVKKQVSALASYTLMAMGTLAFLFITLTTFRNLDKKRGEMGVFLGFGMKPHSFYIFYTLEAIFIWAATAGFAWLIFYGFIDGRINESLITSDFIDLVKINKNVQTQLSIEELNLPLTWTSTVFASAFAFIWGNFIYWTYWFIRQVPVNLLQKGS